MGNLGIKAGFSRQVINPPKGIRMIGYGDRFSANRGVHDDLTATALVLAHGDKQVGIVALDLLVIHQDLTEEIEALCGFPLLLCCAHTHAAPMTFPPGPLAFWVKAYRKFFIHRVVQAVQEAVGALQPARFYWGTGSADIAVNRRERQVDGQIEIGHNPDGPVDKRVAVLEVRSLSGDVLGRLVNMQCHVTVMGPENLLVSADWVGDMRRRLEKASGGMTLYLQGATGDLNPKENVGSDFEKVAQIGEEAFLSVQEVLSKRLNSLELTQLRYHRKDLWIPLESQAVGNRPPTAYRDVAKTLGLPRFLADPILDFLYPWRTPIESRGGKWAFPIQENLLHLGDFVMGTMGMEVFTEIGLRFREAMPDRAVMFASLTNSCYGYLPTEREHYLGGYEVEMSWQIYRMPAPLPAHAAKLALDGLSSLRKADSVQ